MTERRTSQRDDKQEEWSYNQGWNEGGLSHAGKKRLNRQMRDLVRPVHVSALAYTLPDKTKKCCMTWREAISLHEEKTGKRPNWSSQFLQCKLCGKFFTTERNFESHYTRSHVDMSIYNQTLRRLTQWDTTGVSESEVEWNINLIQNIGETLELPKDTVERDILQASRLPSLARANPVDKQAKRPCAVWVWPEVLFACIFHDGSRHSNFKNSEAGSIGRERTFDDEGILADFRCEG